MRSAPSTAEPTISKAERYWLWGAIVFGAVLRLSFPGRMAVEHFDEGVYASNYYFSAEEGYSYPAQHLYAPPLLPMAIEWTMIVVSLFGIRPTGFVPMIPCLIAGIATIPSLWHIARRWFGPSAGIAAAWLVAASDFHASYSRAALTDVPVCLFMLWAVYFIEQALRTGTRRSIGLAGLFTGLAWWTKYNGWLPLAIGLSGGLAWQLFLPQKDRHFRDFALRWSQVVLVAFTIWSPVLWGLQKHGGYAAVSANHRGYVEPVHHWLSNASRQLQFVGRYDNWFGAAIEMILSQHSQADQSGLVASEDQVSQINSPVKLILLESHSVGNGLNPIQTSARWSPENVIIVIAWMINPLIFFLATIVVGLVCIKKTRTSIRSLPVWFVGAWLIGLSLVTPLYHAYPRLMLPWLLVTWLGVAMCIEYSRTRGALVPHPRDSEVREAKWNAGRILTLMAVWMVSCVVLRAWMGTSHTWQDRSGLQLDGKKLAYSLSERAGQDREGIIACVYADPALVFTLRSNDISLTFPVQTIDAAMQSHPTKAFLIERRYRQCDADSQALGRLIEERTLIDCETISSRASHLYVFDQSQFESQFELDPESFFYPYIGVCRINR